MDTRKWKSVAVDIDNYKIITAMGEKGFRRPGAMIAQWTIVVARKQKMKR